MGKRFMIQKFSFTAYYLGAYLVRCLPSEISCNIANTLAKLISQNKKFPFIKSIQANQSIIRHTNNVGELNQALLDVLSHAGKCFIDLHRSLHDPREISSLVENPSDVTVFLEKTQNSENGTLLVAPHLSNFDLGMLYLACRGLRIQILTAVNPTGVYRTQNEKRRSYGLDATPINSHSLARAIQSLRQGGIVGTGIDRPYINTISSDSPLFFGHQSNLSSGYIRLAAKSGAKIVVVATQMLANGKYKIRFSNSIKIEQCQNKTEEIHINAQKVLSIVEQYIRETPEQWLMFYPVWPNLFCGD